MTSGPDPPGLILTERRWRKDGGSTTPDPGADLNVTGRGYMHFTVMQLRHGITGKARLLSEHMIRDRWTGQSLPTTRLISSIPDASCRFGLGAWNDFDPSPHEVVQVASIGA